MSNSSNILTFYYNAPEGYKVAKGYSLNYRKELKDKNINFQLPRFIQNVGFIPERYLDLLEIAAYVYCADRFIKRGSKESPYFSGWQRHLRHNVFVRDHKFWANHEVTKVLEELLRFLSGDIHDFNFFSGHNTPKENMFDGKEYWPPKSESSDIVMFSGGLDSTSGAYDLLKNTDKKIYLVSHISSKGIIKTLDSIVNDMKRQFPDRVFHITFECNLRGERAREETQRTRSFLYASVGAVVAKRYNQDELIFFENGVLSINLPPSEQFQNGRTTRSTHPKVLYNFSKLFSLMNENNFDVKNPFFWKSKADVIALLKQNGGYDFLNSTVSCSRLFDKGIRHQNSHCGRCSQCIDRRFGFAGARLLEDEDRGLYAYDFVIDNICSDNDSSFGREERTMLVDYMRLALDIKNTNVEQFCDKYLDPLTDVVDFIDGSSEEYKFVKLHNLFVHHGTQVKEGIIEFYRNYADQMIGKKPTPNSLSEILWTKEYLDQPSQIVAQEIGRLLATSIPIAFQNHKPKNEQELQDHIEAILNENSNDIVREFPHVPFALSGTKPDFATAHPTVFIEVKYPRGKTPPSKTNKEIAEDCTKYPDNAYLLFVVYDPERKVKNDQEFEKDFIAKRSCQFCFIR